MGTVFGKVFDQHSNVTEKNPGLPQHLHIRTQEIMPFNFDGIKFIFNKSINNQFGINHVINITNGPDNGYRFGTLFTGNHEECKGLGLPTFQGEINTAGHIGASVIQHVDRMRFVTVVNYEKSLAFPQLTFDWIGNNCTASMSASKVTALNYPEFVDCTYLRTVTNNLSLGVRGYYRMFNNLWPIPECLARYESGPFGWSLSISPYDMQLCHNFHVNENLRLSFMLSGQFRDKRSIGHFGYQFSCPKKQITVRGMGDSEWNVRSTVEKPMTSLPIILLLSATLNHRTNGFGLGCGVILNK